MPTLTRRTANIVAGLFALAVVGGLVIRTSSAVFTASTDNPGNSLGAGTIQITDNDGGTAVLNMTNIAPGEFSRDCITVTYTGSLDPEAVKVWSSSAFVTTPGLDATASAMEQLVYITVESGPVPGDSTGFRDCGSFVPNDTPVPRQHLDDWDAASTTYASGGGTWDPPAAGATNPRQMYRITLELDVTTGNVFQGASLGGINVTWGTESTSTPGLVP